MTVNVSNLRNTNNDDENKIGLVRELVFRHGWNTTCFQIVNPGMEYWFGDNGDSVVAYADTKHTRVVAGAPVCSKASLPDVARRFEQDSADLEKNVCYFGAEQRLENIYHESDHHSKILLGAQPVWHPANWEKAVKGKGSLRAQLNRAVNKGVVISEWPVEKATDNSLLWDCLRKWLDTKGLPPLSFMIEPATLKHLEGRRIFVAEHDENVVAFLVLSPIPRRSGWLTEQFPHTPEAPNGTVELMMDNAFRKLAADGAQYVTLGLSPLSRRAKIDAFENPMWLRAFLAWMRKHGQRFYNFDGLDAFKAKMAPEYWEPIFAISNEPEFSRRTLFSIGEAFSNNRPFRVFGKGLLRSVRSELKWLKQRLIN
ncbi:MAG: DUF2156 domain-containing protein [Acidobacteria bacterium]|nr:DUF2156 domain-containing protein [Acidobacteriota bacterium]